MSTKKLQIIDGRVLQSGTMAHASLNAANWVGSGTCAQSVALHVDANNKIDIQADAATMDEIIRNGYCLCAKNDNGAVTIYSIGKKPTADLNVQLTITSVKKPSINDVIWGNVLR